MTATRTEIQKKAAEAASWFEYASRGDDDRNGYVRVRDGSPEWVTELVYAAHHGWSDFLPDDYRYRWAFQACEFIAEADDPDDSGEFADSCVEVYTSDRLAWLSSNLNRASYCDEAMSEFGGPSENDGIIGSIGLGQYAEANEVYGLVLSFLRDSIEGA